jgi:tetratricopeptide (TPR) repeat protein
MRNFQLLPMLFAALWMSSPVAARPTAVSLPPKQDKAPTPLLGDRQQGEKTGTLFLAFCLDQLTRGNLARAEEACGQALNFNPHDADAYKLRGYAYLLEHRFERAMSDFRAALRLKPSDDEDLAGYSQSLSGLGQYAAAAAQFRKALAVSPQKAAYWNGLCWAQAASGRQLSQALTACNRALAIEPGAPGALNSRGLVYLRMKRFSFAIADYSVSLRARPQQASAWFGRGLARLSAAEIAGAEDITDARRRDNAIDTMFIAMGVLPARCDQPGKSKCPPGFPPIVEKALGAYMAVSYQYDPGQELAAGVLKDAAELHARIPAR